MTLLGAMAEDRKLFESGLVAVHPKDDKGRVVLFFDRIRAIKPLASRDEAVSGRVRVKRRLYVYHTS